jgi:hypothetical protein
LEDETHSTVIHACQTVNDLIETDKKFRADIEEIGKRIENEFSINLKSQSVMIGFFVIIVYD